MMKGHKLKTKALALFQSPVADIVVRAGSEPIRILGVCANRGTLEYSDQERHSWRWVGTSDDIEEVVILQEWVGITNTDHRLLIYRRPTDWWSMRGMGGAREKHINGIMLSEQDRNVQEQRWVGGYSQTERNRVGK